MRKFLLLTTLTAAAVVAAGITVQAQTYGPGMMGNDQNYSSHRGYGPGYGMMGGGYGPGYHMRGWGGGYGPGMMRGNGYGPGMMQGYGPGYGPRGAVQGDQNANQSANQNLTTDDVKGRMERWLNWRGNARLKVGEVKEKDADSITADIVTKDNSLVERFIVDRHSGFVRRDNS